MTTRSSLEAMSWRGSPDQQREGLRLAEEPQAIVGVDVELTADHFDRDLVSVDEVERAIDHTLATASDDTGQSVSSP
jgi:hypothetical protein